MSVEATSEQRREQSGTGTKQQRGRQTILPCTTAEWISLVVMLMILGAIVGPLIWASFHPGTSLATFAVTVAPQRGLNSGNAYYLPVHLKNTGGTTAENVIVRVAATDGTKTEDAEMTFAFVAAGEEEDGVAVFTSDISHARLEAHVSSYLQP